MQTHSKSDRAWEPCAMSSYSLTCLIASVVFWLHHTAYHVTLLNVAWYCWSEASTLGRRQPFLTMVKFCAWNLTSFILFPCFQADLFPHRFPNSPSLLYRPERPGSSWRIHTDWLSCVSLQSIDILSLSWTVWKGEEEYGKVRTHEQNKNTIKTHCARQVKMQRNRSSRRCKSPEPGTPKVFRPWVCFRSWTSSQRFVKLQTVNPEYPLLRIAEIPLADKPWPVHTSY